MTNDEIRSLIQIEIAEAQQPLLVRIAELEGIVDQMMDEVLTSKIMLSSLEKLIPVHLAAEIAESLEAELGMVLEPQRSSTALRSLYNLQQRLADIGRLWQRI